MTISRRSWREKGAEVIRTGDAHTARSSDGRSTGQVGRRAVIDEDVGGSDTLFEPGDTGELGEEVIRRFGSHKLRLAQEIARFGVLDLLLRRAVEDTHGLHRRHLSDEIRV